MFTALTSNRKGDVLASQCICDAVTSWNNFLLRHAVAHGTNAPAGLVRFSVMSQTMLAIHVFPARECFSSSESGAIYATILWLTTSGVVCRIEYTQ